MGQVKKKKVKDISLVIIVSEVLAVMQSMIEIYLQCILIYSLLKMSFLNNNEKY